MNELEENKNDNNIDYFTIGLSVGAIIGVAGGLMFDQPRVGVLVGLGLGLILGYGLRFIMNKKK